MDELIYLFVKTEEAFKNYLNQVDLQTLIKDKKDLEDFNIDNFNQAFNSFKDCLGKIEQTFLWGAIIYWSDTLKNKKVRSFKNESHNYWKANRNKEKYNYISKYLEEGTSKDYITILTDIIFEDKNKKKPIVIFNDKPSRQDQPSNPLNSFGSLMIYLNQLWDADQIQPFINQKLDGTDYSISNYKMLSDIFQTLKETNTIKINYTYLKEIISNLSFDPENKVDQNKFLNFLLWARMYDDKWKAIYYLPALLFEGGVGGAILSFEKNISDKSLILLQEFINRFIGQLSLFYSKEIAEENLKKHGTRAAAASIIGRNMSHNIGSHVIYYLFSRIDSMDDRNPLHKVVKEFATFTYNLSASEYAPNEPQDFISSFESKYKSSDSLKNFEQIYRELVLFLNYLQARMDYVALACTIEPKYGQGLKISDMIQEFQDNNILKEGIVASEGVKTLNIKKDCKSSYNGLVTIPFGEIGKHAFYSILENIIRNSAKRGKPGKDLTLYYSEKMSDDKKYVVLEIYDGLGTYNVAKERMNLDDEGKSALTSDYILESGELNHDFLGIKEIRLSVAFLRMVAFYEELQMAPRGLELEPIKVKNGSRESLKYIIHLKPYKYLLMINNDEGELAMVDKKYYIDKCGFKYLEKHSKDINEYKIAVSETQIQKDQRQKFNLPNRVVQCNNEIKTGNWDDVILKQYKKWIEVTYNCDPEKLAIYFKPLGDPEKEQKLREAWKNVINVDENLESSHICFIGHMDQLSDYKNYFDKKKSNNIVSAESVEKSSHILKQMLMQPPKDDFHKNLLKLELLESALTKVLIIDERLYNKYQCHFNDFEIDGKAYTLKLINSEAKDTFTKGTEIGIHENDLMDIGKWLSKKKLSEVELKSDRSKLTYNSEDSFCLKKNGLQDAMSEVPNNNHLFKFLEALTTLYERQINLYSFSLKNISICSLFEKTDGIDVVDLSGSTLFSVKNESSELPIDAGKGEGGFHFLSVHLGMIDTIADFLKTSQANIVKFFDDKLKNTYFIIHTGRGKTINIEKTTDTEKYPLRFTDFTTLNTWVNGSKWLLVQGLYSIKKQVY